MSVQFCIPVIPSADLEKSLRLWTEGLGFTVKNEMRNPAGRLINCMLQKDNLWFMLNQRAGTPIRPDDYHGISLYWNPTNIHETRDHLKSLGFSVSEIEDRFYGQTEFFLEDDDGFTHCFGVDTKNS